MITEGAAVVGNDIVDLRDPETIGKAEQSRFVERVLTGDEQTIRRQKTDRDLWSRWAAKESVWKVVVKTHGERLMPRQLHVDAAEFGNQSTAEVHCRCGVFPVQFGINDDYIHCVAWSPESKSKAARTFRIAHAVAGNEDDSAAFSRLSTGERKSARSTGSSAARRLAKRLLCQNLDGINEEDLQIVRDEIAAGFGPPRFIGPSGKTTTYDLSLSHHGRFIAAAVGFPR